MIEENNSGRKKLKYAIIVVILITVIGSIPAYTYFTNSLNSALKKSLETFDLYSVNTIPTTNGVELNITYILRNPTDFPITVETIIISFTIDNMDIGGINMPDTNKTVPAKGSDYFYFSARITDETILRSLQNETYKLSVAEGSWISGSTGFLFFQINDKKIITGSEIINNT